MHEEGGWIIRNKFGLLNIKRGPSGTPSEMSIGPKPTGAVATFHVHPLDIAFTDASLRGFRGASTKDKYFFTVGEGKGLFHYIGTQKQILGYNPTYLNGDLPINKYDLSQGSFRIISRW